MPLNHNQIKKQYKIEKIKAKILMSLCESDLYFAGKSRITIYVCKYHRYDQDLHL